VLYTHLGTSGPDGVHEIHERLHLDLRVRIVAHVSIPRKILDHDRIALMWNSLPDLLGDERHEWMKESEPVIHHMNQHVDARSPLGRTRAGAGQSRLDQLDVPVAELVPDEMVDQVRGVMETEFFQGLGKLARHAVQPVQDPSIFKRELSSALSAQIVAFPFGEQSV